MWQVPFKVSCRASQMAAFGFAGIRISAPPGLRSLVCGDCDARSLGLYSDSLTQGHQAFRGSHNRWLQLLWKRIQFCIETKGAILQNGKDSGCLKGILLSG